MTPFTPIDWQARLAEHTADWRRRREHRRAIAAEFATARAAGLRQRHAQRLAHTRATTTPDNEPSGDPDGPTRPCGCTPQRLCPQHWQAQPPNPNRRRRPKDT